MTTALAGGSSSPASLSKGKAKMDAREVWTCGICLAKSREPIRGELDCCAHHFCFVCIMSWARVESRCPFCKARFRTIRRPPIPGRFPSERIVAVPERNQVSPQILSRPQTFWISVLVLLLPETEQSANRGSWELRLAPINVTKSFHPALFSPSCLEAMNFLREHFEFSRWQH
jgi:hypothetical protein